MDNTLDQHWSRHTCAKSRAASAVVEFNGNEVRIRERVKGLSVTHQARHYIGITRGCPFCWRSIFDLSRRRDEIYRALASVASPEEVAADAVYLVRKLNRPNFPSNGICSHHGVHKGIVSVSCSDSGRLRVIASQSLYYRSVSVHQARVKAIADALVSGVETVWNGREGSESVTVVLERNAPESLLTAQANYLAQKNVFKPTAAEKAGLEAFILGSTRL